MNFIVRYKEAVSSSLLLALAFVLEYWVEDISQWLIITLYLTSYATVGLPVIQKAWRSIRKGTLFSEFFLMSIATLGAIALGEYAEGVAVMLFYTIGEYAQGNAVSKARRSIEALVNQQPDIAIVERDGETEEVHPSKIETGEIIRVKPGEKVPLDGELLTDTASFNTAALTGESKPMTREAGEEVWAGSINQDVPVRIKVTSDYKDTKLSNILTMVQEASQRKAATQRFMTRFAKVYTPIVVWLAVALTFIPYPFVENYVFQDWFYRALIFLVVSCPCGLVISIPLGYFGGIGAASRNGILLKGSDFLDQLRKMNILFLDKTGTLTEGTFEVQEVYSVNGYSKQELLTYAASLEQQSTHPIAKAILNYTNGQDLQAVTDQLEVSGKGLKGKINEKQVLAGNRDLMLENGIQVNEELDKPYTYVHVGIDGAHAGTISIADRIKEDSKQTIVKLRKLGLEQLIMISGDNQEVVNYVADQLDLDGAFGSLLPDEKYKHVEKALTPSKTVGFIGDGVNDAPVITLADVGIAMGGIGSDATVETADVVIQTDQPSKIPVAINIARFTHRVVWQNIGFALGVKILVMILAALGMATMWEAIFADVGVALIAITNAIRVQNRFTDSKDQRVKISARNDSQYQDPENCCQIC